MVNRCLAGLIVEKKIVLVPLTEPDAIDKLSGVHLRGGSRCFRWDGFQLVDINVEERNVAARLVPIVERAYPSLLIITSLDKSTCLLRGRNSWLAIIDTIRGYFLYQHCCNDSRTGGKQQPALFFFRLKPIFQNIISPVCCYYAKNTEWMAILVNEWMNESKVTVWMETCGPFINKI